MLFASALLALQAPFAPLNHKPLPPSKSEFTFVALGDNRPAGAGLPPTASFRELLKEVSIVGPAFILSSGDLLYGNEETVEQYRQEVVWLKPILAALPCPFFNAPGNHEINNRPEFLKIYQEKLGSTYGRFDFGNFRFLAVCTELPADQPSIFGDQLAWLKREFANPKPTIVFHHHPVFKRPTNPDAKGDAEVDQNEAIHKMYLAGGVKAVMVGHDHVYNTQVHDGITYTIAGGAGAPLDAQPLDGGFFHFVLVHVKGDEIEQTPIPMGAIEVTPISDGAVAVAEYADAELPIANLRIASRKRPTGVKAEYATKKNKKKVKATILAVRRTAQGFETQVGLTLPKHRATFVRLTF